MRKKVMKFFLAALIIVPTLPAWAIPFISTPADTLGPLNGGSVLENVGSPGASAVGGATLTFDLLGYLSVDGSNCCTDTFMLTVNGSLLFSGGFDMGGGGTNFVNFSDPGVTVVSSISNGFFQGGLTQFSVSHTLLSGNNTYLFDYGSMQGLGDEGWGLQNMVISADVGVIQVPEPGTLVLLGLGLVGMGFSSKKLTD